METLDGVEVIRYRYAPGWLETLVNDGGIVINLKRSKWKCLLVPRFVLAQAWGAWRLIRRERVEVIHAQWLLPQVWVDAMVRFLLWHKVPQHVTSDVAAHCMLKCQCVSSIKSLFSLCRC